MGANQYLLKSRFFQNNPYSKQNQNRGCILKRSHFQIYSRQNTFRIGTFLRVYYMRGETHNQQWLMSGTNCLPSPPPAALFYSAFYEGRYPLIKSILWLTVACDLVLVVVQLQSIYLIDAPVDLATNNSISHVLLPVSVPSDINTKPIASNFSVIQDLTLLKKVYGFSR